MRNAIPVQISLIIRLHRHHRVIDASRRDGNILMSLQYAALP